ncbi:hypothetical protein M2253_000119 [Leucobacter luti]|uniref:hypothetical protein n=2 Tax=Leucobacter luti TaxID=340320 RepID=UPI0010435741|nr:hypothetical protein [Leucobacter luti]MCW2287022.1 hypothetical protein [Leucobacter luti]
MSRSQKPRTPRYWPRMKVRGARRKRLRTMYVFQRIGDAGNIASEQINTFGQRLINMQNAINRMYERAEIVREDPALLVRPRRAW